MRRCLVDLVQRLHPATERNSARMFMAAVACILGLWRSSYGIETPLSLQPYRVQWVVIDAREPTTIPEPLLPALEGRLETSWGSVWQTVVCMRPDLWWTSPEQITTAPLSELTTDAHYQVTLVTWIQSALGGWQIQLCSHEPAWKYTSAVVSRQIYDSRDIPSVLVELSREVFRPVGRWEKRDDQTASLTVQAGLLTPVDPAFTPVQEGDLFQPWIIRRKRDGSISHQQTIPWTYFVVTHAEQAHATLKPVSALASPLSIKARGRVEFPAIKVRALYPQTVLRCVTRPPILRPLAAHRVVVQAASETARDSSAPEANVEPASIGSTLFTDRRGEMVLSATQPSQVFWINVYSGKLKLAQLPVLPGEHPRLLLTLPDDRVRLRAEGELQQIQSDLVAEVARRAVILAAARTAAQREDWAALKTHVESLKTLTPAQAFIERVSAVRVNAINAARTLRDRLTEQRVVRLCNETVDIIQQHLGEERQREIQEELAELDQSVKEWEAGRPPPKPKVRTARVRVKPKSTKSSDQDNP
ncbi:MAG: hypothetical protein KatS3mg113_0120 [Planctomycetaceae bacterium]|nr:MAG: hypothetical protein KatS3mg113_0120 [Planctomycetaceae bacterium]